MVTSPFVTTLAQSHYLQQPIMGVRRPPGGITPSTGDNNCFVALMCFRVCWVWIYTFLRFLQDRDFLVRIQIWRLDPDPDIRQFVSKPQRSPRICRSQIAIHPSPSPFAIGHNRCNTAQSRPGKHTPETNRLFPRIGAVP